MSMGNMPWFRFYNEALNDRKISRICRVTGQPKALVIGVWVTFLTLASESPERGRLLISDDLPFTTEEIIEETGLDEATFKAITEGFTEYGMLDHDGTAWVICNWHSRQPPSDNSTERVRRYRQRQKEEGETADNGNDETLPPENDETLPKRDGNGIDKELETEKETEKEGEGERSAPVRPRAHDPEHQAAVNAVAELMLFWSDLTGKRPRESERENEWIRPLNSLLIRLDWDTERVKVLLKDGRKSMLERGLTPFKPSGIVPSIIADLDGAVKRVNGHAPPKPRPAAENPQSVTSDPNYKSTW